MPRRQRVNSVYQVRTIIVAAACRDARTACQSGRRLSGDLLPRFRALLDVRVITTGARTVVPHALRLLCRGLLDVRLWTCCHRRRVVIRRPIIRIPVIVRIAIIVSGPEPGPAEINAHAAATVTVVPPAVVSATMTTAAMAAAAM